MTEFDPAAFADVDPAQFASMVTSASKDQLAALMSGEHREKILNSVFGRFPAQFRPDRAGSTNAVIHWHITGRPDGDADTYEVVIADGACTLSPATQGEPKVTVTISGTDLLDLVSGGANPMMLFMTGKLKAKGDLGLAANLANLFDLPKG